MESVIKNLPTMKSPLPSRGMQAGFGFLTITLKIPGCFHVPEPRKLLQWLNTDTFFSYKVTVIFF